MLWSREGADWPNRSSSRFVRTPGQMWHVQRFGAGPRLLLLHGAGASTHSWRDFGPELARDHEILAPDLPGHGFSRPFSEARCALPAMAEEMERLLEAEGFEPDAIIGHSAGAAVALRMSLDRPRPCIGLNAALKPFEGSGGSFGQAAMRMLSLAPLLPFVFSRVARAPGAARSLLGGTGSRIDARGVELYSRLFRDAGHARGALAMMSRWDLEPLIARLDRLTAPVGFLVGDRDVMVGPEVSRRIAGRISAPCETLSGLGHLMHEEAPDRVADAVRALLEGFREAPVTLQE